MNASNLKIQLVERGLIPDSMVRAGIRDLLKDRLNDINAFDCELGASKLMRLISAMNQAEIAPLPQMANLQHYEVDAQFFRYCLGVRRKYSSCFWLSDTQTLDEAEILALEQTCDHAALTDGQDVLELGCGWGSLSLWMAEHYPNSKITGVSNSNSQREFIMTQAKTCGLSNLTILTADMNVFDAPSTYDRLVSVEMFEHMRNYKVLYGKVASWLKPGGKFFKHIFVHRNTPYFFEVQDDDDWMSQYFFSGGMMPSDDLPLYFQDDLRLVNRWRWDGTHYEKTANAWLSNMDINKAELTLVLAHVYGNENIETWRNRWRIFFMACAELFGYNSGQEWWVSHFLFEKK